MKQVVKDLIEVKNVLHNPNHWTKGAAARDHRGNPVPVLSHDAKSFCLLGAANKVTGNDYSRSGSVRAALQNQLFDCPVCFNDDPKTTHEDIINLIDAAIKTEKKNVYR